jgi:hypothetical protein
MIQKLLLLRSKYSVDYSASNFAFVAFAIFAGTFAIQRSFAVVASSADFGFVVTASGCNIRRLGIVPGLKSLLRYGVAATISGYSYRLNLCCRYSIGCDISG